MMGNHNKKTPVMTDRLFSHELYILLQVDVHNDMSYNCCSDIATEMLNVRV